MYLDLLILARLDHGPAHGYEIKKHVARLLGGTVELNNNVLYPALRHFGESGAIERVDPPPVARGGEPGRVPRQVYRITDAGQDQLQALLEETGPAVVGDPAEFKARVAFFDRVEPVLRRQLVTGRRKVVEADLATMESLRETTTDQPWALRVVDFEIGRARQALAWLDDLGTATRQEPSETTGGTRQARRPRGGG